MKQELYQFDETFLPQETLKEIADSLPTPFYLYDEHGIRKQVQRFFQAFHWVPEYRQFFPVSLAPLPGLLKILREEGSGVCCSSLAELLMAERCGFSGVQILYTPFFPDAQACEKMRDLKAGLVLDNMASADFVLLNGYLPDRVSLRYHPSEYSPGSHTRVNLSRMLLGMPKNELLNLAKVLQDAGVQQLGLSIQLTKQCSDRKLYATAADLLLNLAKELRQIGVEVSFCDLGGGIGLGFLPEERDLDPVDVSSSLEAYLDEKVPEWFRKMALWSSAGRSITGASGIFVARVLATKQAVRGLMIVDASVTQFPRVLRGSYHHVSVVGKLDTQGRSMYDIVGCVPDQFDRFADRRILPRVTAGDYCVFHHAGFDSGAMQSSYGGRPVCGEYLYCRDGTIQTLRKPGTAEDLLREW